MHEDGEDLVFDHLYIERRMTPLNLYLRTASAAAAERAVLDYGQCIRDLAYTNIFPGDLLLKNFGVTRHGRVIFYDYDELCRVTDCNFRDIPQAANDEDEMRGEAWFYVAENDVFPETFINFLAFNEPQRAALLRVHGEILTAAFWRGVQQRLSAGDVRGGPALSPAPRARGEQRLRGGEQRPHRHCKALRGCSSGAAEARSRVQIKRLAAAPPSSAS